MNFQQCRSFKKTMCSLNSKRNIPNTLDERSSGESEGNPSRKKSLNLNAWMGQQHSSQNFSSATPIEIDNLKGIPEIERIYTDRLSYIPLLS